VRPSFINNPTQRRRDPLPIVLTRKHPTLRPVVRSSVKSSFPSLCRTMASSSTFAPAATLLMLLVAVMATTSAAVCTPPTCSVPLCTKGGAEQPCTIVTAPPNGVRDCAGFANLPSTCAFACTADCLPPADQPCDNNGQRYCNLCNVQEASCASGFQLTLATCPK